MKSHRFRKNDLHPHLWKCIDQAAMSVFTGSASAESLRASSAHSSAWMKHYGKGMILGVLAWFVLFFGAIGLSAATNKHPLALGLTIAVGVGGIALGVGLLFVNYRTVVRDELIALLPSLNLGRSMQPYVRALIALADHPALSAQDRQTTLNDLNHCIDQAFRLETDLDTMTQQGVPDEDAILAQEEADLQRRLDSSEDPITRQTYAESLRLCQRRRDLARGRAPYRERAEAQLALIYQSLTAFAESLERGRQSPVAVSHDLDTLRTQLADVQTTAEGLEEALRELQTTSR